MYLPFITAHIFMDDAFEVSDHSAEDSQVNRFVKCLVETIDEAASEVHYTHVRLRPPKKYPTPYGGRLVWTLPGKTKMICHLKDKSKIRHRKRWSQVKCFFFNILNQINTTIYNYKNNLKKLGYHCQTNTHFLKHFTGNVHVLLPRSPTDGFADISGAKGGHFRAHLLAGFGRRH